MQKNTPPAASHDDVTKAIHAMGDHIAGVITDLATNMDERFAAVETSMNERFDAVDKRFDAVDKRFEQVDGRFDQVYGKFNEIDSRLYKLEKGQTEIVEKLDNLDGRVASIENDIKEIYTMLQKAQKKLPNITKNEVEELQARMAKIIQWAERVSAKTGIPMPQL